MITREWILIVAAGLLAFAIIFFGFAFTDMSIIAYSGDGLVNLWLRLIGRFLLILFLLWVTISHLILLRRFKRLQEDMK